MQTLKQRARLLKDMESEPLHTWAILAKCGGGLAALALIAVIGASAGDGREAVSGAQDVAAHTAKQAQEHRKQVFDERRARFARGVTDHNIASETSQRATPLLLMLR